ncbi:MAG: hypothetical protein IJK59_06140 [Firmicutes bacterium]|nr:hypothetical protein [Bacillota bacterium]MBQ6013676.1 hypothetical protein [Bacillota bacterium]MBQ6260814.1 hypothetical protein [Bacillota bacterium]MBR0114566.1 hypothetical protein [Bacillota bacterium]MBR0441659.1 hypothetical protein [Bacillota bacterium]
MKRMTALLLAALLVLGLCGCGSEKAMAKTASGSSPTVSQIMEDASKSGEGSGDTKEAAESKEETAADAKEPEASDPALGQVSTSEASSGVDVDLAAMSSTLVFAEVQNIMYDPYSYVGKIIRMKGTNQNYRDKDTKVLYHAIVIRDATACCAQGIEYQVAEGGYPKNKDEATVVGEFELYMEGDVMYCRLKDSVIEEIVSNEGA